MLSVMTVVGTLSRTSSHAALLGRGADHAEGGAIARGRQRAGIAVRQNAGVLRYEHRSMLAHGATALHVLVVDRAGFVFQPRTELVDRFAGLRSGRKRSLHALDRPEQIHCRRPRRGHQITQLVEIDGELACALGGAAAHAEGDPHRRGNTDRRRAANDHRLDRARHFRWRLAADVDLLAWQLALIDHHNRVVLPVNRRQHWR